MNKREPRFPHKNLIIGIFLLILGSMLLLWRLGFLHPSLGVLWPIPFLLMGLFFLYLVILKEKSPRYLLPGTFLSLIGTIFLLINTIIPVKSLEKIWPVFMLITGISILPYSSYKKTKRARIAIIIPAIAIICLSLIFFAFSLDLINENFIKIALRWWPTLIIFTGGFFIVFYYVKKKRTLP